MFRQQRNDCKNKIFEEIVEKLLNQRKIVIDGCDRIKTIIK